MANDLGRGAVMAEALRQRVLAFVRDHEYQDGHCPECDQPMAAAHVPDCAWVALVRDLEALTTHETAFAATPDYPDARGWLRRRDGGPSHHVS